MNKHDIKRNYWMLNGKFARKGYDWWWHNFTAIDEQTGEERPFFIEYFTCNPAKADVTGVEEPILGQLPANKEKGIRPSYLMMKCGWWGNDATQLHRFIPWKDVTVINTKNGYKLTGPDCYASETYLTGKVDISETDAANHPEWMCNSGSMEWDIHITKDVAFNVGYGAGGLFRFLKAFQMYWHAEGMKSTYSGTITANGRKYKVIPETSFGYADKNWGSDFTSPWVWLSSNDLVSTISGKRLENSVFDIGGGRPKVFGIYLNRKLLSDFWYEGKSYEFNFSKFWTFCKTKFDCKETEDKIVWNVRQETTSAVMETEMFCDKSKMLLVNYEAPDGQKRHNRLWNGGHGEGKVKLYKKVHGKLELLDELQIGHAGCEWGEYC
ncbi:MAG: hypothetical protein MJ162_05810 [Treponema sp.]|nr:hypothetical protein [Treponema sp.]